MLVAILKAQAVNKAVGGLMVTPFDVDDLPAEWVEACTGLTVEVPNMARTMAEVEKVKNSIRNGRRK